MIESWIVRWIIIGVVIAALVALAELFFDVPEKAKQALRIVATAVIVIILIRILAAFAVF